MLLLGLFVGECLDAGVDVAFGGGGKGGGGELSECSVFTTTSA